MLARAAEWNPSVFRSAGAVCVCSNWAHALFVCSPPPCRREGPLPEMDVAKEYLKLVCEGLSYVITLLLITSCLWDLWSNFRYFLLCHFLFCSFLLWLLQAVRYDNAAANSKYCLAQMLHTQLDTPTGRRLLAAHTLEELW